jgi:hypothetical protein
VCNRVREKRFQVHDKQYRFVMNDITFIKVYVLHLYIYRLYSLTQKFDSCRQTLIDKLSGKKKKSEKFVFFFCFRMKRFFNT